MGPFEEDSVRKRRPILCLSWGQDVGLRGLGLKGILLGFRVFANKHRREKIRVLG